MNLKASEQQVVSKQRVADHGEVYTCLEKVNAMIDLVRQETERIDSRFLEPACGTGNFLTDFRERSLKDVITQLEPGLFKKVTGLDVADFELLVSLGVFNGPLMNDAVYKFKRYEDASLRYVGIDKHEGEEIGLFDTVLRREDVKTFENVPEVT